MPFFLLLFEKIMNLIYSLLPRLFSDFPIDSRNITVESLPRPLLFKNQNLKRIRPPGMFFI
ncbi:hypothetical protein V144x_24420 [Gimesia aquarii]|uniref:Uncharacterized protein n=1 Tax=Gimesia aquarii TaxID=2527964 RepID=A0A517VVE5_9PLAN|nr:hypothetical protein V144x_24420 [Gimesia aquarii]